MVERRDEALKCPQAKATECKDEQTCLAKRSLPKNLQQFKLCGIGLWHTCAFSYHGSQVDLRLKLLHIGQNSST